MIADLWITHQQSNPVEPVAFGWDEQPWQEGCWQIAQTCAAGLPVEGQIWADYFQSQMTRGLDRVLLSAWPVLLVAANRWGLRQAQIADWASGLGFPPEAVLTLVQLFRICCHSLGPMAAEPPHFLVPEPGCGKGLCQAQALVRQTQGAFSLALALAFRQKWSASAIALVGLLAAIQGGNSGISAQFSQTCLGLDRGLVRSRLPWPTVDRQTLWQVADALYERWAGVAVRDTEQPRSTVLSPPGDYGLIGANSLPTEGSAYNTEHRS
ncbi:MAG: hypothetical protein HC922_10365 [Leptolyngbyaceae cyanobacterium SM2_3_12]|nr:hypothetical protein [Leptolyngbyaceae cyanobacterium SM2_3_12]